MMELFSNFAQRRYRAIFLGLGLLQACFADMNPPKPINTKAYVTKIPKIRPKSVPDVNGMAERIKALRQQEKNAKHTVVKAHGAWQKRMSSHFSQASKAGTVSTLLNHR